jgi:hypothetical protein
MGVYFFKHIYKQMKNLILKILHEEVKNGNVICDNCGWSWSLKEGGHDPYICHQCNHNNEPKKTKTIKEDTEGSSNSTESNPPDFKQKLYDFLKKKWDENGFNLKDVVKLKRILGKFNEHIYITKYFGGIENIMNKYVKKLQSCLNCSFGNLSFEFVIDYYELNSNYNYTGAINLYVDVSEDVFGTFYSYNDKTISARKVMKDDDYSEYSDDLERAIIDSIEIKMNQSLNPYGVSVEVVDLVFVPFRLLSKNKI